MDDRSRITPHDCRSHAPIVLVHKDHPLAPDGINAGAETATIALARAFARKGHLSVVCGQLPVGTSTAGLERPHHDGVRYADLGPAFDTPKMFAELDRVFQQSGYHLIVASRAQALLESRYNPHIISRIFITHEPSAAALGIKPEIISRVADRVVCVSEAQREGLVDAGCSRALISVIPNGADLSLFTPGDPDARDYRQIVFVGALVIDKGVHLLIEAFSMLSSRYPDLKLDIYGSAKMWGREEYFDSRQVAAQLPRVKFHGAVPQRDLVRVYETAGLLVLPSLWFDSFPLTAVEAQVCGLPVVGSPNGGMREIIRDNVTGRILPEVTPARIAEEIEGLVKNPETLKRMSRAALEELRPMFSWDRIADRVLELQKDGKRERQGVGRKASPQVEERRITEEKVKTMNGEREKIGLLTTFHQRCGLSTYAEALLNELRGPEVVVLAEDVPENERVATDGPNVRRCWRRGGRDFSEVERILIEERIELLHINCHHRFFERDALAAFLGWCQARGIAVVTCIHNPYTVDPTLQVLVRGSDRLVVHMPENRLELIANGARPEAIDVIEHGVVCRRGADPREARRALGIPEGEKVVVTFGFVQPHKGIDEVIYSIGQLRGKGMNAKLYCVGGVHTEDAASAEYMKLLRQMVSRVNLSDAISFVDGFTSEEIVDRYLTAAHVVVMNYRSQWYEGSGAIARALGCGAPVVTSTAPAFAGLRDVVFHATSGFPLPVALELVLTESVLSEELRRHARSWSEQHSWSETAKQYLECYRKCRFDRIQPRAPMSTSVITRGRPRVLMQNRRNALLQRGGDTVVMERLARELESLGVVVEIDLTGERGLKEFDLVHLFNFATPDVTRRYAERCVAARKPYLVTTLYEDLPSFYAQMLAYGEALRRYVTEGQKRESWETLEECVREALPAKRWENSWTAEHAAALLASGEGEAALLRRDYRGVEAIVVCPFGCDPMVRGDADAFLREFGVTDFVLCVGRLETRKNQLMLLKALEESELPIVFATGGFTYQPEYEEACRRFRRKGRTLFLGRLNDKELANAYAACRVHVLPSWYELPGLVSLEAATAGKNIVVTDRGTIRDYVGEEAFYCAPDDPQSITNAVIDAYYGVPRPTLRALAGEFTWGRAAEGVREVYEQILSGTLVSRGACRVVESGALLSPTVRVSPDAQRVERMAAIDAEMEQVRQETLRALSSVSEVSRVLTNDNDANRRADELCVQGDEALRAGDSATASRCYLEASHVAPSCVRAYRSLGVVALRGEDYAQAEEWFRRALKANPRDAKSITGLGATRWGQGCRDEAFCCYIEALDIDPCESSALLHLMNAAYVLNRLSELERRLENFLVRTPESADMRYSLAGCFYKQGKLSEALRELTRVLEYAPEHRDALELKAIIEEELPAGDRAAQALSTTLLRARYTEAEAIEEQLHALEEAKEKRKFDELISSAAKIITGDRATEEQRSMARLLRAEAYALTGRLEEADAELNMLEAVCPQRHRVLAARGAVAAAMERWGEAESFFSRALAVVSKYDVALAGMGVCRLQEKEFEAAWEYFQQALAVNAENMRALLGVVQLGYPLQRLRDVEGAIEKYLEMHPANIPMLYAYAGCCYAQGKRRAALNALEKIRLFDPEHRLANELLERMLAETTVEAVELRG